jgi:tRNA 2-thiouridine synthesizing protein A
MSEMPNSITELDARRLLCPLPVIRTQNALKTLPVGALLRVYCTDPGTLSDIPTWCRLNGHRVLEQGTVEREQHFLIEKTR